MNERNQLSQWRQDLLNQVLSLQESLMSSFALAVYRINAPGFMSAASEEAGHEVIKELATTVI